LQTLETAVVISGSHNDALEIKAYTNGDYHKKRHQTFQITF